MSSYPALERKFLVSADGGAEPRWSGNSRELFYRSGDKMMAVDIHADDVTADGQRFVMIREDERARKLHVVVNWHQELKRLVPRDE